MVGSTLKLGFSIDPGLIAREPIEFLDEALCLLTLGDLEADDALEPLWLCYLLLLFDLRLDLFS